MNQFLEAALKYAKSGWHVFPLKPRDKVPITSHGFKDAGDHSEELKHWWTENPLANIGLACGPTGVVVIDLDVKEDGPENWAELVSRLGIDDNTATCLTGGGGQHIYFRKPQNINIPSSIRKLGPGIDVKAEGGYVVLPPSNHPNGKRYEWEVSHHPDNCPILPLPQALITLLENKKQHSVLPTTGEKIAEGRRNDYLASLAGSMRRRGMSRNGIVAALQIENEERCQPPLPEEEVGKIAGSISRYPPGPPGDKFKDLEFTDLGNARRIEHLFGKDLRFCEILDTWFVWNGEQWRPDEINEVRTLAHEVSSILIIEAAHMQDKDKQAKIIKHALFSQAHGRITGMIEEAKALLPIVPQDMDKDLHLFNCGGTIDLGTGSARDHRRDDLITRIAPVIYDPAAACPIWIKFLHEIMLGNVGMIRFLQKMVGYALTGYTTEQCIFVLHGTGCNGKSTFVSTLKHLFGNYAAQTSPETFMVKREQGIPSDVARLRGVRLAVAAETDQGRRLSESLIKQISGGDAVSARELFGKWFEFVPNMKFWLVTNHKPVIRGTDQAIWRRIRLIPFNYTVPENLKDETLPEKLLAELSGILNWAIKGCMDWQSEGLGIPEEVREATSDYREEMDLIGGFLSDRCTLIPNCESAAAELYAQYKDWCQANEEEPVTSNLFGRLLTERGLSKRKETIGAKRVIYKGIRLSATVKE
jgi:putative DNA primase/helicase